MDWNNVYTEMTFSTGKSFGLLTTDGTTKLFSPIYSGDVPLMQQAGAVGMQKALKLIAKIIGVSCTRLSHSPLQTNERPIWTTWRSLKWPDLEVRLIGYTQDFYPEYYPDISHVITWVLKMNKPFGEIDGALTEQGYYEENFIYSVTKGLYRYGFRLETPIGQVSPSGRMFASVRIKTKPHSKRVIVKNTWARDV